MPKPMHELVEIAADEALADGRFGDYAMLVRQLTILDVLGHMAEDAAVDFEAWLKAESGLD